MGKRWAETVKAGLVDERMGPEWNDVVELWYTLKEGTKLTSSVSVLCAGKIKDMCLLVIFILRRSPM
jgi:hypothetical protein